MRVLNDVRAVVITTEVPVSHVALVGFETEGPRAMAAMLEVAMLETGSGGHFACSTTGAAMEMRLRRKRAEIEVVAEVGNFHR